MKGQNTWNELAAGPSQHEHPETSTGIADTTDTAVPDRAEMDRAFGQEVLASFATRRMGCEGLPAA